MQHLHTRSYLRLATLILFPFFQEEEEGEKYFSFRRFIHRKLRHATTTTSVCRRYEFLLSIQFSALSGSLLLLLLLKMQGCVGLAFRYIAC